MSLRGAHVLDREVAERHPRRQVEASLVAGAKLGARGRDARRIEAWDRMAPLV
jgi:hypothetical protein